MGLSGLPVSRSGSFDAVGGLDYRSIGRDAGPFHPAYGPADPDSLAGSSSGTSVLSPHDPSVRCFGFEPYEYLQQYGRTDGRVAWWYALQTRSRHEKMVDEELRARGVETFLPLFETKSKRRDRYATYMKPLFPGYVFASIDPGRIGDLFRLKKAASVVGPEPGRYATIPHAQIDAIQRLVASDIPFDPYPQLASGIRVRVIRGRLRGVEGVVIERKKKHILVLSVDLLARGAALRIHAEDVEMI